MNYAVIRLQGHQYKVAEGEEILVDKISEKTPVIDVLLLVDDKKVHLGKPTLNAKVDYKVLGEEKGKKLLVRKYKAKSRYRKRIGFRPQYTKLLIKKITLTK